MNESHVFPEIQVLLKGLGKTLNEVAPTVDFITCVDLYSLNRITEGVCALITFDYFLQTVISQL